LTCKKHRCKGFEWWCFLRNAKEILMLRGFGRLFGDAGVCLRVWGGVF